MPLKKTNKHKHKQKQKAKNKKNKKKKKCFQKEGEEWTNTLFEFCEMQFFSAYISHLMFSSKFKTAPSLYQQRYLFQSRSQKKLRKGKYGKRQFKLEISRKSTNDLRTSLEK